MSDTIRQICESNLSELFIFCETGKELLLFWLTKNKAGFRFLTRSSRFSTIWNDRYSLNANNGRFTFQNYSLVTTSRLPVASREDLLVLEGCQPSCYLALQLAFALEFKDRHFWKNSGEILRWCISFDVFSSCRTLLFLSPLVIFFVPTSCYQNQTVLTIVCSKGFRRCSFRFCCFPGQYH